MKLGKPVLVAIIAKLATQIITALWDAWRRS